MYIAYDTIIFRSYGIHLFHFETREYPLYWKPMPNPLELNGNFEALLPIVRCGNKKQKTYLLRSVLGVQTY